ncbi:MAG TPA: hypothetical protein VNS88_02775 [Nitrospiraceae bacterium]|nr:hypothetical protein [Nitrospiraceae bacterium]
MSMNHFGYLIANPKNGIERCPRLLVNHRDSCPANPSEFGVSKPYEILATKNSRATHNEPCRREKAEHRQSEGCFPAAGFAKQAHRFARRDFEGHALQCNDITSVPCAVAYG